MRLMFSHDRHQRTLRERSAQSIRRRRRSGLESLEDRTLLSTLNISGHALSYLAGSGVTNKLTISTTGTSGAYNFNDTAEPITLGAGAIAAGWTGGGTNNVTGPDSSVTSISVNTLGGNDSVSVQSIDALTTIAFTNAASDLDTVNLGSLAKGVQAILGNVTITNTSGKTALTIDDSGNTPTSARNPTLAFGAVTNLAPRPIFFGSANLSSLNILGGGLFGTLNVNAGKLGPVSVEAGSNYGSGVLTIATSAPLNYANFAALVVTNAADLPVSTINPSGGAVTTTAGDLALSGKSVSYHVASFTDADPNAKPANFVASIHWGDGTPDSPGTITANGTNAFDVNASHTYALAGKYAVSVAITDTGTTAVPLTVAGIPVTISDTGGSVATLGITSPLNVNVLGAALRLTVSNLTTTEGLPLNSVVSSVVVANFTADNPFAQPGDFTATIDWGDGTTSPGVVQQTAGFGSPFIVTTQPNEAHAYQEDTTNTLTNFRPYTLTVTINDTKEGDSATARGTATVTDASLNPGPIPVAVFTEGVMSGGQVVAQFTDENPFATASDFNVPFPPVISWGGGSSSIGTVVADPVAPHVFDVLGAHLYAEETTGGPPNAISVAITDEGGAKLTALGTAIVSDAAIAATSVSVPTNPATPLFEGKSSTGDVAIFTDANPKGVTGNFTAAIDWGDGTPISDGTIREDATGVFHVSGTHVYLDAGRYTIGVSIHDIGGANAEASGIVTLANPVLVSDGSIPAAHTDPNLVNPWGIATGSSGTLWVADNGKGRSSLYDGAGAPQSLVVGIPAPGGVGQSTPTGIVSNSTAAFVVPGGPSHFLFDTQDGTIAGWNSGTQASLVVNNSASGAVYTGLALTGQGAGPVLYAANFHAGVVEMYSGSFTYLGSFTEPNAPAGFAPYNVQAIAGQIFVTFAKQDATKHDAVAGPGNGFVDIFTTSGAFVQQLIPRGTLNAPWGIVQAPNNFGPYSNDLLVANHGDGTIDAFDPVSGQILGALADGHGARITVDGLLGLSFVNGADTLYYTAGPNGGAHGLLSSLTIVPEQVTVLDATLRLTATNITATEGIPLNSVVPTIVVATFTDDNTLAGAGDFSATINWGDGTTSPGVVQQTDGPGSGFIVTTRLGDSHVYKEDSTGQTTNFRPYTFTVTVTDTKGGATATNRATATVNDARLEPGQVPVSTYVEGTMSGIQVVAQFIDDNPFATAGDFNAPYPPVITWGGGSTSLGTVVADPVLPHVFDVIGAHLYAEETTGGPPNTISVTITDEGGSKLTALGTAVVDDAPLAIVGLNIPTNPATPITEGKAFTSDVALFTDANPKGVAGNFTASITWGDGTPTDAGTIREDGTGNFHVSGSHTYAEGGVYLISVVVHDIGGSIAVDPHFATVIDAALTSTGVNVPAAVEGASFTSRVATFTDANPVAPISDFTATIAWGDGVIAPGVITQPGGLGSPFIVTGTHTYVEETLAGRPNVLTVMITDVEGNSTLANPTAAVADATISATPVKATFPEGLPPVVPSRLVATFTDADPLGNLIDDGYTASIDWGDGKTTDGTIAAAAGGGFNVAGVHNDTHDGTYAVKVTVSDKGGSKSTVTSTFTVTDPALVNVPVPAIMAAEGKTITNRVIGDFTDPNVLATAAEFKASIDWADGTPIVAGTVQQVIDGGVVHFKVVSSHTYAKEGMYKTKITISDAANVVELNIDPLITVIDAPLIPTPATFYAIEQVPFTANVATFIDGDAFGTSEQFTAKIDWGDGTATNNATVTAVGSSSGNFTYVVSGSHTYNDPVTVSHQVTVTMIDPDGSQTVALSQAVIGSSPSPNDPQGATFTASEGVQSSYRDVATFTDADPAASLTSFIVAINWGDGTLLDQTSGKVTAQGAGSGKTYLVSGSHLFAESGTYSVGVTVTDKAGHVAIDEGQAVVADGIINVLPPPLSNLPATEGKLLTGLKVASFTESNPLAPVTDFNASIDWGDGSPNSQGTITQPGGVNTPFVVTGDHTFVDARSTPYIITVTIVDFDTVTHGVTTQATATTQATVKDAPLNTPVGKVVQTVEGRMTNGQIVATFLDPNPLATVNDYSAMIDWGDQTSSDTGVVSLTGSGNSGVLVQVSGAHTYAEVGSYPIKVTLIDVDNPSVPLLAVGSATVNDAALGSIGAPVSATESVPLSNVPVAVFSDANPNATVADFPNVTIDWGDGGTSKGTLQPIGLSPNGVTFIVLGSHTYNDDDTATMEVESAQVVTTITDKDGSATVAISRATEQDPVLTDPVSNIQVVEGASYSGVIATLVDLNPLSQSKDFTSKINWGDGTTSNGAIVNTGPGHFNVNASHIYLRAGVFTITVTSRDNDNHQVTDTGTATVKDAPLVAQGIPISITTGVAFHGSVATFTEANPNASVGQFASTIDWGDGSKSVGTVVANANSARASTFAINGYHAYRGSGTYSIVVTIIDRVGARIESTSTAANIGPTVTLPSIPFRRSIVPQTRHITNGHGARTVHPRGPRALLKIR